MNYRASGLLLQNHYHTKSPPTPRTRIIIISILFRLINRAINIPWHPHLSFYSHIVFHSQHSRSLINRSRHRHIYHHHHNGVQRQSPSPCSSEWCIPSQPRWQQRTSHQRTATSSRRLATSICSDSTRRERGCRLAWLVWIDEYVALKHFTPFFRY